MLPYKEWFAGRVQIVPKRNESVVITTIVRIVVAIVVVCIFSDKNEIETHFSIREIGSQSWSGHDAQASV